MALGQIHLGSSGPEPCRADPSKDRARGCPFEASGHYSTQDEAELAYENKMGGALPASFSKRPEAITLTSNLGKGVVVDGDLSDPLARALLSSGLCGDLALAIHRKTGGTPYFLSHSVDSDEELAENFKRDPESIVHDTLHVLIESPTKPNHFIDAYGQSSYADIEDNWDGATVIEGTPEMLEQFADKEGASKLSNFADSALELDRTGVSYSMQDDALEADDEDWGSEGLEGEELSIEPQYPIAPKGPLTTPERIKVQLDFGEVEITNGDFTDPQTRFMFANGLCGDLAMALKDTRGGNVYFAVDSNASDQELEDFAKKGELGTWVAHAFLESKHHPGKFVDSYGVKTKEEIEEFFGFDVRKVDPKLLESYGSGKSGARGSHDLSEFARTLEKMDQRGESYSYYDFE